MKTGLVIGINYVGTSHELQGCVRDAEQVYHMLKYDLAYDQVTLMTGESSGRNRATKANIIGNIQRLVSSARSGDQLFLHYSGHGTQVTDYSGSEDDGKDECLVPLDSDSAGYIVDDELRELIVDNLPSGVRLIAVFDCCNSGTALDLRFKLRVAKETIKFRVNRVDFSNFRDFVIYVLKHGFTGYQHSTIEELIITHDVPSSRGEVIMISGCRDNQYSLDNSEGGVLTLSLLEVLKRNDYHVSYADLLKQLRVEVKNQHRSPQVPQMTFGAWMDVNRQFFSVRR